MLPDPLNVPMAPATSVTMASALQMPVISFATDSKGIRRANAALATNLDELLVGDLVLTIAQSKSKESPPVGTTRTSTRLDYIVRHPTSGVPITCFGQFIFGVPNAILNLTDCHTVSQYLLSLLLYGDNAGGATGTKAEGDSFRARLYTGEA